MKKFCKALVEAPISFLITQNSLKLRKIGAAIREGSKNIFSIFLKQTITHPFRV